jgi:SSS family solute:Na+ symporter
VKILALVIYMIVMVAIGFFSLKRTKNIGDFFLANRSLGPWVSAIAYGGAYFSAVIFIGYAGRIGWGYGLSDLWIVAGNTLVGSLLAWLVLAKKTRSVTEELNARTMPEFLEARYRSKTLKYLAAVIIFILLVPYSASVYMGLSYLFDVVMGIPYVYALLLMAILTGVYLVMGGYFAVSITTLVQGGIMFFGSIYMVLYLLSRPEVGGMSQVVAKMSAINPKLVSVVGPPGFIGLFGLVVLTSFGPWGLPQMVQKFYSIKNQKVIFTATIVTTVFALVCSFSAYFSGALTHLFFKELPTLNGVANPDLLMPNLLIQYMPTAFSIIFLLLVFSASMSTLSSLVLVSSSAITIDLLPKKYGKDNVTVMRILCILFIFLSLIIAISEVTFIVNLMSISWGATAGSFAAPYVYGLFWKKANRQGALASMITGLAFSLILSWAFGFKSSIVPFIGSLAILIPFGVLPIVSILTGGNKNESLPI